MKPISCQQEMGDTEGLRYPGASQGPGFMNMGRDGQRSA